MSEEEEVTTLVPVLPEDVTLEYLAEGAANVVYRLFIPRQPQNWIIPSAGEPHEPGADEPAQLGNTATKSKTTSATESDDFIFQNRVLRLRKSLASTVPNIKSARSFKEILQPLFPPGFLVEQDLVRISAKTIVDCNLQLREDEACGKRPRQRHGVYLAEDEPYGVLVTDMTPGKELHDSNDETQTVLIEFKSKWLAQSPSAPPNARRCRTCALRAQRNMKRISRGEEPERSFCPLDLVSDDRLRVEVAVHHILASFKQHRPVSLLNNSREAFSGLQTRLAEFLHRHPLLLRLQKLQIELDQLGPLYADKSSQDFLIAMTLRDCTVFLKVSLF